MRLGLWLAFGLFLPGSAVAESAPRDFVKAHALVRLGKFAEGRALYAEALEHELPAIRSMAQLAIAQSYLLEGKLGEARREYARLPSDAPAHHQWEAREKITALTRREQGLPERDPEATRTVISSAPPATVKLHVAANGSDRQSGSLKEPFATVERARDEIRARRTTKPEATFEVLVHGGEYTVRDTLRLDARDSGTTESPIVYRAMPGEEPVFRGGVRLTGLQTLASGANYDRLPEQARGKVVEVNLQRLGISNILPLKPGGFGSGNGFKTHPMHELFFNGKAMQLARGPNTNFLRIRDVVVEDGTKGYDRKGSKTGKFIYEGDHPARWKSEPELLLYGYWFWDWADSYERVVSIDTTNRVITLAEPFHKYGYSINAPFYAINALSELDQPGEWHLDRRTSTLLLYPPSNPQEAAVELSIFPHRMLELQNVAYVRFEGLTWELGSGDAIRVADGNNVLFAGCTVRHFAGNGVEISGGLQHGILSCDIYSMGRGGTIIAGGNRKTLARGGHFLENTEIHSLSRIDHTYTPAAILSGVGNRVAHNRFHEIPSSAIRLGGNDHVIEFNEIFNVVQESDDQGGADMYGNATYRGNIFRYNSWHHIGNWQAKARGTEEPKCGQAGIRLDDAISGTLVYGNIFERCSAGKVGFGGVQIHGGKDNIIENNLFVACAAAVSFTPWGEDRWRQFAADALNSKEIDSSLYIERYPELGRLNETANRNHIWRNRTLITPEFFRRAHQRVNSFDNLALDCCDPSDEIPGFNRIPHEEIGLYVDSFRRIRPAKGSGLE